MESQNSHTNSKILISGGSGFIGSNLATFLISRGFEVFTLTRKKENLKINQITWDPSGMRIDKNLIKNHFYSFLL
jgi:nucleoside-diphosphate-sugar epimerase